jgi:hypothetical protein
VQRVSWTCAGMYFFFKIENGISQLIFFFGVELFFILLPTASRATSKLDLCADVFFFFKLRMVFLN